MTSQLHLSIQKRSSLLWCSLSLEEAKAIFLERIWLLLLLHHWPIANGDSENLSQARTQCPAVALVGFVAPSAPGAVMKFHLSKLMTAAKFRATSKHLMWINFCLLPPGIGVRKHSQRLASSYVFKMIGPGAEYFGDIYLFNNFCTWLHLKALFQNDNYFSRFVDIYVISRSFFKSTREI